MPILEATGDSSAALHRCLVTSGTLVHHRRRCEDSRLTTLADVQELLEHLSLAQGVIFLATDGDDLDGFAAATVVGEPAERKGRLHFFVVRPGAVPGLAEQLLDRLLAWFAERGVSMVRQARLDPISSLFRVEQDRNLIDLFRSRGFAHGPVAGNMEVDVQNFHWTDPLQASAEAAEARDIVVRAGRAEDAREIQSLNRAEGLPEWDYHLRVTAQASRFDLLLVAEDGSNVPAAPVPTGAPPAKHDGRIVAYANYFAPCWETKLPEFGPLLVASSLRHWGLGRLLTARALQVAQAHDKQRVRLSTMATRFDFYRALGFEVTVTWYEQLWKTMNQ